MCARFASHCTHSKTTLDNPSENIIHNFTPITMQERFRKMQHQVRRQESILQTYIGPENCVFSHRLSTKSSVLCVSLQFSDLFCRQLTPPWGIPCLVHFPLIKILHIANFVLFPFEWQTRLPRFIWNGKIWQCFGKNFNDESIRTLLT
jgi:hypothetical protein